MRFFLTIVSHLFFQSVLLPGLVMANGSESIVGELSLAELENRLSEIDSERSELANLTLRSGVGSLGWQSQLHSDPGQTEWARIDFSRTHKIDQVALVPILWRETQTGIRADGFPTQFDVIIGETKDSPGTVVASFENDDKILPRIAPLVIPFPPVTAKWISIKATKLSSRAIDGSYLFQLSEIMAFSGDENVALHQPVSVSSSTQRRVRRSVPKETLVDGVTPYLINSTHKPGSTAYVAFYNTGPKVTLSLDLKQQLPLNRLHLHAADLSENVPQVHHSDYGIPKHLIIEASLSPDFRDSVQLVEFERETIYDAGPTLSWRFPETLCRYLRIRILEGYKAPEALERWRCIGFAEIEIFSNGTNVATGKHFQLDGDARSQEGALESLTDGRNHFGTILPLRNWMEQLARRHDLETERPQIITALNERYEQQKSNLRLMSWLAALFATGIAFTILIDRIIRMRQTALLKERFAADLHDELGADLHTIGLLSDLALGSRENSEKLDSYLHQIRSATEETGAAVRHLADMQSKAPYSDLETVMKQIADRVVVHLQHNLKIEGKTHLNKLPAGTRSDLFLFYKECLINICRHSEATVLQTALISTEKMIHLAVSDNGQGMTDMTPGQIPHSLQRRAKLLKGKVSVESSPKTGTSIHLKLNIRRFR